VPVQTANGTSAHAAPAISAPVTPPPVAQPVGAVAPPPVAAPLDPPPAAPASGTGRAARTVTAVTATRQYHRPECELLIGLDGQSQAELTKVAAIRQGYLACSACRP
jgi:hypothetical protein